MTKNSDSKPVVNILDTDWFMFAIIGGRRFCITTSNAKRPLMKSGDHIESPFSNEDERQMWVEVSGKFHEMVKNSPLIHEPPSRASVASSHDLSEPSP